MLAKLKTRLLQLGCMVSDTYTLNPRKKSIKNALHIELLNNFAAQNKRKKHNNDNESFILVVAELKIQNIVRLESHSLK